MVSGLSPGEYYGKGQNRAKILEVKDLENGWHLLRTEGAKRPGDFRVRLVTRTAPTMRSFMPKIGHFAIDLFGKSRSSRTEGTDTFEAIVKIWKGLTVQDVLEDVQPRLGKAWGYPVEYVLLALDWLLMSEDINFSEREEEEQASLDDSLRKAGIEPIQSRRGSELAISLFCDIINGTHPIDALRRTGLDVIPAKRARGAV